MKMVTFPVGVKLQFCTKKSGNFNVSGDVQD